MRCFTTTFGYLFHIMNDDDVVVIKKIFIESCTIILKCSRLTSKTDWFFSSFPFTGWHRFETIVCFLFAFSECIVSNFVWFCLLNLMRVEGFTTICDKWCMLTFVYACLQPTFVHYQFHIAKRKWSVISHVQSEFGDDSTRKLMPL